MTDEPRTTPTHEVERVLKALASARFGTAEERGAAMVAIADAGDLIRRQYDALRSVRRIVEAAGE